MSLVATYVRANDGKMYRNPVMSGKGWFICFDDDDPVELVIFDYSGLKPKELLKDLGIEFYKFSRADIGGMRMEDDDFKDSNSWFFEIKKRIPAKLITRHDGIVDRDEIWQGVIYDPKT